MAQKELREAIPKTLSVQICSKVGFFSKDQAEKLLEAGLIDEADASLGHSFHPAYIKHQVLKNLNTLNLSSLDILFLHNPERCFSAHRDSVALEKVRGAFGVLEEYCKQGFIKNYGIASWAGFEGQKPGVSKFLSLAREVSSSHRFRAIQLPLSLAKFQAIESYFNGHGPLLEGISEGLEIYGSSPLHGGKLPPLINQSLCDRIDPYLTPAQACLLFAKSIPGVRAIFTSPSSVEQANKSFEISAREAMPPEQIQDLIRLLQKKV